MYDDQDNPLSNDVFCFTFEVFEINAFKGWALS
jgi:hypothetical protein